MTDGLRKGLASYGDAGFSLFLRKAFIKAMGYSNDALLDLQKGKLVGRAVLTP